MSAHTSTQDVLAPELEAIAAAAANRLHSEVTRTDHDEQQLHRAVGQAASAAIAAGLPLAAIAEAERTGQQRARDELRPDVLRQIARAARRKRETELEYEQAVIRAARLGLGHRELAGAAQVSHGTIRAIIARTDTAPEQPARSVDEPGQSSDAASEQPHVADERHDAGGVSAAHTR
jgi:DNA-binding NarL/FixJ family response regulator